VCRLLAGEAGDLAELRYAIDGRWHLGVVAGGVGVERALRVIAVRLGLDLLLVTRGERELWAWLGANRELPLAEIEARLLAPDVAHAWFAIGMAARGREGWRMSHEQALAAAALCASRVGERLIRCADVAPDAALARSPALARILCDTFLTPLERTRIGGSLARETLGAYFSSECTVSCAAQRLGVARGTLERRLREIENALGRQIPACLPELQLALRAERYASLRRAGAECTLGAVTFRITHHSGHTPPPDALDALFERLGAVRETVSFSKSGDAEITAIWDADVSSAMTHDERIETGRRLILGMVKDVCEYSPPLDVDWFAVSQMPDTHERVHSR
jgi:hypothetical protein